MASGTPTNFRLSAEVIRILEQVSRSTGLTKTEVVELCVLRQAIGIPDLAEAARQALLDVCVQNLPGRRSKQGRPPANG